MARRIQLRRDTAANWSATNPTLAQGEIGIDLTNNKLKIGNGTAAWNSLGYWDDKETSLSNYAGHIVPSADNTYDLGSPTKQWRDIFVSNGSIYIGDIKLSNDSGTLKVQQVTDAGLVTETPVPNAPGSVTTDRLVNGVNTFVLKDDGTVELNGEPLTSGSEVLPANAQGYLLNDGEGNLSWAPGDGTFSGDYDDLSNKPTIPQLSNTQIAGSAVLTVGLDVGLGEVSLIGTLDTGFGPNENTIGKVGVGPGQVNISSLDQDAPDIEFKSEINVYYPTGVTITNSPGPGATQSWVFGNNGKLTLPNGGELWEDALIGAANQDLFLGTKFTPQVSAPCAIAVGDEFVADIEFNDDITAVQVGWTVNVGGADYTVTAIDPAPPAFQYRITANGATFVQGETYTFTDPQTVDKGWFIRQGTGTLVSDVGGAILSSESFGNGEGQTYRDFSIELPNLDGSNEYRWTFRNDGVLELPAGGDIVDENNNSVLGGGGTISVGNGIGPSVEQVSEILFNGSVTEIGPNVVGVSIDPSIENTVRGFINLVGARPNNSNELWFESVVVRGSYAYVLGGDYFTDNNNNEAKVYKFDLETGAQIWVKQITAGRGAQFNISVGEGMIVIDSIALAGVDYKVGEELVFYGWQINGNEQLNKFFVVVDTVDESGGILTASIKSGYNVGGLSGTFTNLTANTNGVPGDTAAISYDDFNNKLVVVQEYNPEIGDNVDSYWNWSNVYIMDPETGAINQTVTLTDDADIYPNSISTYDKAGGVAIVGQKYGEYREFGNLTLLAGYNGYFDILKSNLDPEHYPGADQYNNFGDFWITGTGIATQQTINAVNEYTNLTGTTRQGSGATFSVTVAIPGEAYATASQFAFGTNYRVGHKVKLSGADLGGTTPENDVTITVTSVDGDGGITGVSFEGTSNVGASPGTIYNGISGTNFNVGSGADFIISTNPATGAIINYGIWSVVGQNYVIGDVITIPGTAFAGGTTPANDITVLVNSVGLSGDLQNPITVSGTPPSNALRLRVDGVDFSVEGSWSMKQNLGGEAFIWTPAWSNAIGGVSGDRFFDVCWKADGAALYAVGSGVYEVPYTQALVVKFDATTGAVVWSKDIKFTEAATENREARAVCLVPGSTDIIVAGAWYNNNGSFEDEIILTRITDAGVAVWQKTYLINNGGNNIDVDYEISVKPVGDNILVAFEQGTSVHSRGYGFILVDGAGTVIRHRVLSADGNSNYNYYNTPTANFADIYSDAAGDHLVVAGYTYVPTDNYYNALLLRMPVDGLVPIRVNDPWSIGEHILNRFDVAVTTVTPAFDSFVPTEHVNTIVNVVDGRNYKTREPDGLPQVWTHTITDDSAGYLEFGDGSRQSFATNIIPQVPAANDYILTTQDSGKHIFFEHENGVVFIPHRDVRYFPVGFTFTIVNTTGSDCWLRTMTGESSRARLKLAGRNIDTIDVGIPDSGSGSMVTVMKIKDGYVSTGTGESGDYPDVWIVSGPGDLYDND